MPIKDVRKFETNIAPTMELNAYHRRTLGHALTCKCLMCKPPK
jgi:hypothetical protein